MQISGGGSIFARVETSDNNIRVIVRNRKARHDFEIRGTIEAGIELKGSEVKSIRAGKISLAESYAFIKDGEVFIRNMHIAAYKMAGQAAVDPMRLRRLLLHKSEIAKLEIKINQKGIALVPLTVYFKGKTAKVELAMAVGRKQYDKRQAIAEKEAKRRVARAMRIDKK